MHCHHPGCGNPTSHVTDHKLTTLPDACDSGGLQCTSHFVRTSVILALFACCIPGGGPPQLLLDAYGAGLRAALQQVPSGHLRLPELMDLLPCKLQPYMVSLPVRTDWVT
jgi:hypothetical protein